MGIDGHPLECPKGGPEEQSAYVAPKGGEKKEEKKEGALVQTGFIDGAEKLVQEAGVDWGAPPTPTFKDKSKCNYKYVSPNPELMQPEPECKEGKPEQQAKAK